MSIKKSVLIGVCLVIFAVVIGAFVYFHFTDVPDDAREIEHTENQVKGLIYVGIKDHTEAIKTVNEVELAIQKIELQNEPGEWITVGSTSKKYQLLKLNAENRTELYATTTVPEGLYTKVKVTFGDTYITPKVGMKTKVINPATEIILDTNIVVNATSTGTHALVVDVLADKSVQMSIDKRYVFVPVAKVETRVRPLVMIDAAQNMTITDGRVTATMQAGTDLDGSTKPNFVLDVDAGLKIENVEPLTFLLSGKRYTKGNVTVVIK